ncbi:hypothetical protein EV700_2504 [Fluviicoccus keumensis]|uniref:Uncharacterized protein n=1 Tax=Fluviicoccus keumensis TaxID=1435465 RepID=A0A4Q7YPC1_9GAMM|nr:hypothetical protein EV700_2504 [Fluviicoccus keumensis]
MKVLRLILAGKSQRLLAPAPFRPACQMLTAKRGGQDSLCVPVDDPWRMMETGLAEFEPGFRMRREDSMAEGVASFHN